MRLHHRSCPPIALGEWSFLSSQCKKANGKRFKWLHWEQVVKKKQWRHSPQKSLSHAHIRVFLVSISTGKAGGIWNYGKICFTIVEQHNIQTNPIQPRCYNDDHRCDFTLVCDNLYILHTVKTTMSEFCNFNLYLNMSMLFMPKESNCKWKVGRKTNHVYIGNLAKVLLIHL